MTRTAARRQDGFDDLQAGELPPLPPGPMPGSGHPSGPLPPLPESDYLWGEPPSGPLPPPRPGRRSGRDQDQSRRQSRHGGPPAGTGPGPAATGRPGRLPGRPGRLPGRRPATPAIPAGYPDNPAGYPPDQDEPADHPGRSGRGRRRRGAPPDVGRGHPGYEGYVDDPRDLDMAPDQGQESPGLRPLRGLVPGRGRAARLGRGRPWAVTCCPGWTRDTDPAAAPAGDPAARPARRARRRVRIVLLAILTVFVVFIVVVGGVGYHYYHEYINPPDFSGPGTGSVVGPDQAGPDRRPVGATLASDGVVASARAFSNAAKDSPQGNALEPGYYRVHQHMKASLALALLLKPSSRVQTKITIPEGFRVAQIIALLGQKTGNLKGYEQAIAHPADLGLPAFANGKPEGYLFPATYAIQPKTSPAAVLKAHGEPVQAERAEHRAAGRRGPRPGDAGRGHHRGEPASRPRASGPQDFPKIAEVIYNRLNRPADEAAARHHRPVRDVAGAQERVQHSTSRPRTTPTCTRACRPGRSTTRGTRRSRPRCTRLMATCCTS